MDTHCEDLSIRADSFAQLLQTREGAKACVDALLPMIPLLCYSSEAAKTSSRGAVNRLVEILFAAQTAAGQKLLQPPTQEKQQCNKTKSRQRRHSHMNHCIPAQFASPIGPAAAWYGAFLTSDQPKVSAPAVKKNPVKRTR
jgi:hypothetical protein